MEVPDITPQGPQRSVTNQIDPNEIEKIIVKPSTELIPDEYEHEDNLKALVSIFYSENDEENMKMLKQAFVYRGYNVSDANLYKLSTKEFVMESLNKIAQEDHQDRTCFILVFMGDDAKAGGILVDKKSGVTNSVSLGDVWSLFTSDRCPSLRYKPKVFIFQASKQLETVSYDTTDSIEGVAPGAYDIPAEADMLLIYKNNDVLSDRKYFIQQFYNNLLYDGHKEDIIGLVTHTDYPDEKRPIIISTMTRKFYLKSNKYRGHHHDLTESHNKLAKQLEDLNEKIDFLEKQSVMFNAGV